jgi:type IV pilus assembly protein PilE
MRDHKSKSSGFTLIELVIAMVIAAILAAIAIPSYSNYVRKARRTEAKTALLDMASLEERFFSTNNTYSQLVSDLGYVANGSGTNSTNLASGYYTVTVTVAAATTLNPATYSMTANVVPTTDQNKDSNCASFTLTNQGAQSASPDTTPASCWLR